jgi:hypothetical protein
MASYHRKTYLKHKLFNVIVIITTSHHTITITISIISVPKV